MPSIKVDHHRIAWREQGQGDPVLLLHPPFFDGAIFDHVASQLAHAGYRAVAPDLPGHGGSDFDVAECSIPAMTSAIVGFVDAIDLGRCHVIGVSLGALVGLRLTARCPEIVRSLMVFGATADEEPDWNWQRFMVLARIAAIVGPRLLSRRVSTMLLARSLVEGPRGAALVGCVERAIRSVPRQRILPLVRAIVERPRITEAERRAIEAPVLAVVGKEDRIRTAEEAYALTQQIERSAVVRLPLCGHLPPLEQPAPTAALINRFLDGARRRHPRLTPIEEDSALLTR